MSTELHQSGHTTGQTPTHEDVSFEKRDVRTSSIIAFLFYMAIAIVASFVIAYFVLNATTNLAVQSHTVPPPARAALGKDFRTMPPEPRLQGVAGHETDAQQELRDKLKADTAANEKFDWIDKSSGIAQIPVKDAMKIIAEKGLPAVPAAQAEKKK